MKPHHARRWGFALFLALCFSLLPAAAWAFADLQRVQEPPPDDRSQPADGLPPDASPPPGDASPPRRFRRLRGIRTANNAIYAEGFGPGVFYSLNYERTFLGVISARIGFSFLPIDVSAGNNKSLGRYFMFPITASYLLGNLDHSFEVGAGFTPTFLAVEASTAGGTASAMLPLFQANAFVGYRYQPRQGGFQFRVGMNLQLGFIAVVPITPASTGPNGEFNPAFGMFPFPYLSLGWAF